MSNDCMNELVIKKTANVSRTEQDCKNEIRTSEVECNQCGKDFRIVSIQVKPVKDDIEKNYFVFPHCNSEYLVSYTDTSTRALQKKIQRSLAKIGNVNYDNAAARKMLRKQRQKLAADMTALRARIEASS